MSAPVCQQRYVTGGSRRHTWIWVLVVGTVLFVAVERVGVVTRNPNFVPSALLLGAAVIPATFLTFISGRRLPFQVPPHVVALATLLGGVIAIVVAGSLEFDVLRRLGVLPMLGVGLIEETSKLLVPLAVCCLLPYRNRADGLLLGVACGAGFAALETMGYAFVTLVTSRGSITETVDLLLLRGFLSPAGHMAWTGISATALFAAAGADWRRPTVRRFVLAFLTAVVLHTLWDSLGSLIGYLVVGVASLVLLGYAVHTSVVSPERDGRAGRTGAAEGVPAPRRPRAAEPPAARSAAPPTAPLVVAQDAGRRIEGPTGRPMVVKLDAGATRGAYSLIEYEHLPGAAGPPAHVHHQHEEAFGVLEGELTLDVGEGTLTLPAGSYAVVPRGAVHRPYNAGAVPVRFFFISSPAMDGFFAEMAELNAASGGAPAAAALAELGARWDCQFVGLPSEGAVRMATER